MNRGSCAIVMFGACLTTGWPDAAFQQQRPKAALVLEGHSEQVNTVAMSPDGSRALSGSKDQFLILWDLKTGRELSRFGGKQTGEITAVAFSPDGRAAASGLGAEQACCPVVVWNLETGQPIRRLEGHTGYATQVQFSRDGQLIISASQAKTRQSASGTQTRAPRFGGSRAIRALSRLLRSPVMAAGSSLAAA